MERLAFLSNSAISLMFNSGAKMMVICFLQVMIAKIFSAYFIKLEVNPYENFSILCQIIIMCAFFAYLTKKIPDLVSSFLNGSPALSGGGMISQAKGMATQTAAVLGTAGGAVAGASAASTAAKARHAASGKPTTMMSQLKNSTAGMLARGVAQNVMARNPLTQGYASGMKSMVGSDGSLQNEKFMKGVRQLAGLEADKNEPRPTKSIRDLATNPNHNQAHFKNESNDKSSAGSSTQQPAEPNKTNPAQPKGDDTQNKKDDSKSGGVAVNVNGNNSTDRTAPIQAYANAGKDKEKTVEKEFRSESQHTASKEQTATSGQNLAAMGDKGTGGGTGGLHNVSNVQQTKSETKNQQTTNNQQTKNVQGGSGAGGKQSDGSMSQLNNYKK